jgi:photosystem II stability/assembly factor-like uncharacterized protein
MRSFFSIFVLICLYWAVFPGSLPGLSADSPDKGKEVEAKLLEALPLRWLGPANMSGRIVDLAVVEQRPSVFYVASASGGLWKTENNGTTWTPVFDEQPTLSLGAVAVCAAHPEVVWVGTGEANPRNSVSPGSGVYQSTDGGKTWTCKGLRDSQHIGRIVIHPRNPQIVYVAALGHLWGPNRERGLYKTTDGGRTWQVIKFIDEDTGFIDIALSPAEPDTLLAAAWQVRRDGFAGGNPAVQTGPGSGLFRSPDGGRTWERLTQGLPARPLGRCGVCFSRSHPNIVYAVVQTDLTSATTLGQPPNLKTLRILKEASKKSKIEERPLTPDDGGIFRSEDGGRTWQQVNSLVPRPFYYGQVRVDPQNPQRVYVLGVDLYVSEDGGRTFREKAAPGTHADHHALWIDPRDPQHLILGGDGGLFFSYDRGQHWEHLLNLPLAQFYALAVDQRRPYRIYGGLQDNGTWGGPSATYSVAGITFADWFRVLGGDGFACQVDPTDPERLFAEMQYGKLHRIDLRSGQVQDIQPRRRNRNLPSNLRPPLGTEAPAFRFNWNAPLLISPHDPKTLYLGGNHLFRSRDGGDSWEILSPDLTQGKPGPDPSTGHTLTALAESPCRAGLLYAGTDDGRVHISRDGGQHWTDLSLRIPGVPATRWISRLVCSNYAEGTAYLTIDRHRQDDRRPYVFRTTDYGETWTNLSGNLPEGAFVHVLCEDPQRPDLLYLGTELGLFLSLDGGRTWQPRRQGLPAVPVHDLLVHPRERELVIATHGRGIYLLEVAPLEELTSQALRAAMHLCTPRPAVAHALRRFTPLWQGSRTFLASNPPYGAVFYYYLGQPLAGPATLLIQDAQGNPVARLRLGAKDRTAGLHRLVWDLKPAPAGKGTPSQAPAGHYTVRLTAGAQVVEKPLRILAE